MLTLRRRGDWYHDDRPIFGVVVSSEAVAFPKHIMEVHEMVNLTVGGRRIGLPYCTLCGAAQAYLTDAVPAGITTPVLRTSGLLSRSNKVMYDLVTRICLQHLHRRGGVGAAPGCRAGSRAGHDGGDDLGRVEGGPS